MPDLGQYAIPVLLAYAGTLLALAVLIAATLISARKSQALLDDLERTSAPTDTQQTPPAP